MIDDGSTDDTLGISRSYAAQDKRVKTFHQANAGVSSARNHGIREAHGEYIIFLDSDDWLEDDAAEFMLNAQLQYPDKLITVSSYSAYFKSDNKLYRTRRNRNNTTQIFSVEESTFKPVHSAYCKIFRTSIIRKHNIHFREGIHNKEDGIFVFEYLHKTNGGVFFNRALFNILNRPGSATKNGHSDKMIRSTVEAGEIMINHTDNSPALKHATTVLVNYWLLHVLYVSILFSSDEIIKLVRQTVRKYTREFITSQYPSLWYKALFLFEAFMPVAFIRLCEVTYRSVKSPVQKFFARPPENEELAPDWVQLNNCE